MDKWPLMVHMAIDGVACRMMFDDGADATTCREIQPPNRVDTKTFEKRSQKKTNRRMNRTKKRGVGEATATSWWWRPGLKSGNGTLAER